MTYPPIFALVRDNATASALLKTGNGPVRFWLFARAPQKGQANYGLPYAVWQQIGGAPENYMAGRPDADSPSLQVDAYAATAEEARAVANAIMYAIELDSYVVSLPSETKEQDTQLYRCSFDVDFITYRT